MCGLWLPTNDPIIHICAGSSASFSPLAGSSTTTYSTGRKSYSTRLSTELPPSKEFVVNELHPGAIRQAGEEDEEYVVYNFLMRLANCRGWHSLHRCTACAAKVSCRASGVLLHLASPSRSPGADAEPERCCSRSGRWHILDTWAGPRLT